MRRVQFLSVLLLAFAAVLPSRLLGAPLVGFQLEGDRWTYRDADFRIEGSLLKPPGAGPFPALVLSHGLGGMAQNICRQMGSEFVKMGFVCIAVDYTHYAPAAMRSRQPRPQGQPPGGGDANPPGAAAAKPGEAGAPSERRGGRHPADFGASAENIKRALTCVKILESLPYVDAKRIGAYGHSMGAFLTIALAAEAPDKIKAAAITAGGLSGRPEFPAPTAEVAAKVRAPFLILHGSADTTVRPEASAELKKVLDEQKVPNERQVFEGVNHDINRVRAEDCFRMMRAWFEKHNLLKPAP